MCVFIIFIGPLRSKSISECVERFGGRGSRMTDPDCDVETNMEHVENIATKMVIRVQGDNEELEAKTKLALRQYSDKMPVLSYDIKTGNTTYFCKNSEVSYSSISYLKNPFKVCPIMLRDQAALPILRG